MPTDLCTFDDMLEEMGICPNWEEYGELEDMYYDMAYEEFPYLFG